MNKKQVFFAGVRDGVPIGIGYFAVAFSLGIAAKNAGLTVAQGFLASITTNASAGEYAVFALIGAGGSYWQCLVMTCIASARYLLMSCAMGQRMDPATNTRHRLGVGFYITDELFAIALARPGYINPYYTYGAVCTSVPFWAIGTAIGVFAGNLLPARLVSALGVTLYGMFLAIILPPARGNRVLLGLIAISWGASLGCSVLPIVGSLSSGSRTILLTVALSAGAATIPLWSKP